MNSALKTRAKLSVDQVIEIFHTKGTALNSAANIATLYGVSEKTVRDIWKGRTWCDETWHLDTTRVLQTKRIGRPKGCRDSKPRKQKTDGKDEIFSLAPDLHLGEASKSVDQNRKVDETSGRMDRVLGLYLPSDVKDDLTVAHLISASDSPPQSFASSPLPSSGAVQSVDQQLHEWGQALWLDLERADPFRKDWNPQQEGASATDGCGGDHSQARRRRQEQPPL
jgi:hypothetical protein